MNNKNNQLAYSETGTSIPKDLRCGGSTSHYQTIKHKYRKSYG